MPMSEPPLGDDVLAELERDEVGDGELLPWAMFMNGPQWTKAAWPSSVCTRFGLMASLRRTVMAPAAWSCSATTGSPSHVYPTVIAPRRSRRSCRPGNRQDGHDLGGRGDVVAGLPRIAVRATAEAEHDSGAVRSLMSTQRRQLIESGSMPSLLPCRKCASSMAASRLLAAPIAWMSPVKWRFRSSMGTTCA